MLRLKIPKEIKIIINENWIEIKGPLGVVRKKKSNDINLKYDSNLNEIWLLNNNLKINHFHLSLINKLLWGVWKGFSKKLNIVGVGYKVFLENNSKLVLKLGFSHDVIYNIPKNITVKILSQKLPTIVILGTNFQKVNQVAAEIKSLKFVESYKGKGIRYFKESIKLKEGKKTNV